MPDKEREDRLQSLLGPVKKRGYGPACLGGALKLLEAEDDARCFKDLSKEHEEERLTKLVFERVGETRSRASATTPDVIKNLRPPIDKCWIVWQQSKSCFQGYYPREEGPEVVNSKGRRVQTHITRSGSYGSANCGGGSHLRHQQPLEISQESGEGQWGKHGLACPMNFFNYPPYCNDCSEIS